MLLIRRTVKVKMEIAIEQYVGRVKERNEADIALSRAAVACW
jgi:hypothetical protein